MLVESFTFVDWKFDIRDWKFDVKILGSLMFFSCSTSLSIKALDLDSETSSSNLRQDFSGSDVKGGLGIIWGPQTKARTISGI